MFGKKKHPQVLVVGAGPVGQFTALDLARRGIEVQIIDGERRSATHSYALALHPSSIALLDQVGLLEPVLDEAVQIRRVAFFEGKEREAEVDLSELDEAFPFVAVLGQARFESLLEHALKDAGVKVQWNHRLARFNQSRESVIAEIDKLTESPSGYATAHLEWGVKSSKTIEVPFMIGADGHRSVVRQQLGIPFPEVRPAQTFAIFEFSTDEVPHHEMRVMFHGQTSNVVWPLANGIVRFGFELLGADVPADTLDKDRSIYEDASTAFPELQPAVLRRLLAERAPWFEGLIGDMWWRVAVRFERRLAPSFGAGRSWLVGDAAHDMGPVGMRSMNVGLSEGAALSSAIAHVLGGSAKASELARYGATRSMVWDDLLGQAGRLTVSKRTAPWVERNAQRLHCCLPASGMQLRQLLGQLHLMPA